ncbi:MAG: hypothetical protein H6574_02140 [Lewinellaceae bacterium]|nr:hypothetical protein [Saprospiraceae bacterium]MCB9329860.1 hypothetical protein [Lewinellaceae bacterium]
MRLHFNFILFLFLIVQTASAQTPPDRWRADIQILQQELPKRHPDLFRNYSQEAFEADLADLSAKLEGHSDLQIALELQAIVAQFGDGQTRLELTPLLQRSKVIPVGLGWFDDGLYISATVKKFGPALGKKILAINGMDANVALERMGRYVARENDESYRRDAPLWFRFPEAMRQAGVANSDTLAMIMADEKGQRYFIKTFPIDFRAEKEGAQPVQYTPKDPDLRWNPMKQMFSMNWLESDSIAYLQYNVCFSKEIVLAAGDTASAEQFPSFRLIADSVITLLDQYPGARFFFDLRFNAGGNPSDGIALAERLAAMPFVNLPNRLFVAVNRNTSGAAVEIAAAFRQLTNAQLLGEVPAQRPDYFGDQQNFTMPNSRIQVFYGARPVKIPTDNPNGLTPDKIIEQPFAEFRDGKDPVLDFVRGGKR